MCWEEGEAGPVEATRAVAATMAGEVFQPFFLQFLSLQVEAATMAGKVFQLFSPPISQPAIPIALQIIEFKILHGQHHSHHFEDTKIKKVTQ